VSHGVKQPSKLYQQSKGRVLNSLVQRSSRNWAFINYSFAHTPVYNTDFVKIWDFPGDVFLSTQQYEEALQLKPLFSADNHVPKVHHCLKWLQFFRMKICSLSYVDLKGGDTLSSKTSCQESRNRGANLEIRIINTVLLITYFGFQKNYCLRTVRLF